MGRHSGPVDQDLLAQVTAEPTPGSRRARLRAERDGLADDGVGAHAQSDQVLSENTEASAETESVASPGLNVFVDGEHVVDDEDSEDWALHPVWPGMSSSDEEVPQRFDAPITEEAIVVTGQSKRAPRAVRSKALTAAMAVVAASLGTAVVTTSTSAADPDAGQTRANLASLSRISDASVNAVTFALTIDGKTSNITTTATSLADALAGAGFIVNADDKVSSLMAAPVLDGAKVTVVRVTTKQVTETVTDPYESSEVEDGTLAAGTMKVTTQGVDGVVTNTYAVTYEDGKEISRTLEISASTSQRVDEVVSVGTKEEVAAATSTDSSASASTSTSTVAAAVVPAGEAQQIASGMMSSYGWDQSQFACLVPLWNAESGWSVTAANSSSGAYGIPQALPGSKMASAGADWQTSASTQIKWGLSYIAGRYSTPCGAWAAFQSKGWY